MERQINLMLLNMQRRMTAQGMEPRQAAEMVAGLRETARPEAVRAVKVSLLLDSIADKESVSVGDEEIEERLRDLAARYGQNLDSVKKTYHENNMMEDLRAEIKEQKTLDLLADKAKITTVKKSEQSS